MAVSGSFAALGSERVLWQPASSVCSFSLTVSLSSQSVLISLRLTFETPESFSWAALCPLCPLSVTLWHPWFSRPILGQILGVRTVQGSFWCEGQATLLLANTTAFLSGIHFVSSVRSVLCEMEEWLGVFVTYAMLQMCSFLDTWLQSGTQGRMAVTLWEASSSQEGNEDTGLLSTQLANVYELALRCQRGPVPSVSSLGSFTGCRYTEPLCSIAWGREG